MTNVPQTHSRNAENIQAIKRRIRFIFLAIVFALVGLTLTLFGHQFFSRAKYFNSTATAEIKNGSIDIGVFPMHSLTIIRPPKCANELMKESILSKVVESLKLTERLSAPDKPISKAEAVRILEKTVFVKEDVLPLTKVSVFNTDRLLAAEIANAIVNAYSNERVDIEADIINKILSGIFKIIDEKRNETKRLFSISIEQRLKYEISDSDPDSMGSELSIVSKESEAEKKRRLSEYIVAKSDYLEARALLRVIESSVTSCGPDQPTVILRNRAEPEALTHPSHTLPSDKPPVSKVHLMMMTLCGMVAGVGLTFIALRNLIMTNIA